MGPKSTNQVIDLVVRFAAAIVAAVASLGFVAFVGGIVLWSRFEAAQLPADQAVALQPRADLITVGAIALVIFVLGGLLAVLLMRLLDKRGRASLRTRNGLIVVAALEILAAMVIEEWEREEIITLGAAAAAGLVALWALLDAGGWWYDHHRRYYDPAEGAYRKLARRAKEAFFTGRDPVVNPPLADDPPGSRRPRANRLRLWTAVGLMVALVIVVAIEPEREFLFDWLEGYTLALVPLALALLLLGLDREKGPTHTWGSLVVALGVFAAAAIVFGKESEWVGIVALLALGLIAVNLMVAKATGARFLWYGVTVFLSVVLFGTAFAFVRGLEDPQAQAVAFVRANDTKPVCGLYVGETDDRLYYARLDLRGNADVRRLRDDSGRLLWVPRDRILAAEIGPLEPVDAAQSTALDLRQEVATTLEPPGKGRPAVAVPDRPPRSATGQDPCGPAAPPVTEGISPQRDLAARFQPRLLMSEDDLFWPVSLLTIFDLKKRGEVLCRRPACVPVRSQADLPFRGGVTEWLEYPGDETNEHAQHRRMVEALDSDDEFRTANQYFLRSKGTAGAISLQYWYFYVFNYQPLRGGVFEAGYHEGDFETVGVVLSRDEQPRAVFMARHDKESQVYLWDEPVLRHDATHVDVYVARGSHASYNTCTVQVRREVPGGLINDRPECKPEKTYAFEPGQVALWNLGRARWACWQGRFGHVESFGSKRGYIDAKGPMSPLWQQGRHEPCAGVDPPTGVVPEGEEPLPKDHGDAIAAKSRHLGELIDECDDWRKPQPQGVYVVACEEEGLRDWVRSGLADHDGTRVDVRAASEDPGAPPARPIDVLRYANVRSFDGWRVSADGRAAVTVYASCIARDRMLAATFKDVEIGARRALRLRHGTSGAWRIEGARRPVKPVVPVIAPLGERAGDEGKRAKPARHTDCNR